MSGGNTADLNTGESAQIKTASGGDFDPNYCCIQEYTGQFFGAGNILWDPLFVDELGPDGLPGSGDEDLQLGAGSPCIDAGDNDAADLPVDLLGNVRRFDDPDTADTGNGEAPLVDIGAYEFGSPFFNDCPGDLDGDRTVGQADLGILLAAYGQSDGGDIDGDGDTDQADLGTLLASYGDTCD